MSLNENKDDDKGQLSVGNDTTDKDTTKCFRTKARERNTQTKLKSIEDSSSSKEAYTKRKTSDNGTTNSSTDDKEHTTEQLDHRRQATSDSKTESNTISAEKSSKVDKTDQETALTLSKQQNESSHDDTHSKLTTKDCEECGGTENNIVNTVITVNLAAPGKTEDEQDNGTTEDIKATSKSEEKRFSTVQVTLTGQSNQGDDTNKMSEAESLNQIKNGNTKGIKTLEKGEILNEFDDPPMSNRVALWQKKADDHHQKQLINPFSGVEGAATRAKLSKDHAEYGRPVAGSSTERRGKAAHSHIMNEVYKLCYLMEDVGQRREDGTCYMTFGALFKAFETINDMVVGLLMRARKQRLLHFEGEMLFQNRDENVIITLLPRDDPSN